MAVSWYVLRSKPHKEDFLFGQLLAREIEVYYPRVNVKPVNPRAKKHRPYFPGYMFINVDLEHEKLSTLKWMPGAIGLVAFGKEPAWVPDELVNTIRKQVSAFKITGGDSLVEFQSGDELIIQDGPFEGYGAVFDLSLPGNDRVRVLLKLLEDQYMCLELPMSQIRKRSME
jgi:transcriptional antiterminator RfaH